MSKTMESFEISWENMWFFAEFRSKFEKMEYLGTGLIVHRPCDLTA
jgi:hypothetical protein